MRSRRRERSAWHMIAAAFAAAVFLFSSLAEADAQQLNDPSTEQRLAQRVVEFDNHGEPLIPTLLKIAADYSLPMGVERVVPEAVERPIDIHLRGGTVADLLTLCIRQISGYTWAVKNGAVDVFGAREESDPANLLNFVIPSFEVQHQLAEAASDHLRTVLVLTVLKPRGVVGSYPGSVEPGGRRISLALRRPTVREALNRIVTLGGDSVWVARVPPDCLSHLPEAGLWVLLPHSIQNPRDLLDLTPCGGKSARAPAHQP